jgi:predicted MPP superfamily phosphohydrolase
VATPLGASDTLRIKFASDFHAGPSTPKKAIDNALEQLARIEADVMLLGGDFVSLRAENARDLARRLADIPAPLGRYAVLGNHDHWSGGEVVTAHLEDAGITVLTNRHVRLKSPFGDVSICGLDDHTSGAPDANAAFAGAATTRIVLMHAPSNLLDVGDRAFCRGDVRPHARRPDRDARRHAAQGRARSVCHGATMPADSISTTAECCS